MVCESFAMRNKLRLSKKGDTKGAPRPGRDEPRASGPETSVRPAWSCSRDEAPPEAESAARAHTSNVAAAAGKSDSEADPLRRQRSAFVVKGVHVAPLLSRAARRGGGGGGVATDAPAEKPQESASPMTRRRRLSTAAHVTEGQRRRTARFPPSALHRCLEEVQARNPAFPAQTVFSALQRKASSERLQDGGPTESSRSLSPPQNHVKEKRKRASESSERVPKRVRPRLSMGARHAPHSQGAQGSSVLGGGNQSDSLSDSQSLKTCDVLHTDSSSEDALWTDKYSPQHSSEVIGNSASVNKLQSWLKKWKLKADCDERRKTGERKQGENSSDSWDCGDFQGEAGGGEEEPLWNGVLITGPPGVGKTAAVYACSQELGFKVFEVNCSSQRSGCHVLSQLREATQSHLVETSGKDPLKPTYLNNYSCTTRWETLPGKTVPPKNASSTGKKRAAQNFGRCSRKRKANPPTVTLANYFKMKSKADRLHFGGLPPPVMPDGKKLGRASPDSDQTGLQNKKTATSLILFEEVDVIFDDDVGFLGAVKTFMATTKRPVVLTTSDPSFRERFNCSLEEIVFKTPSAVSACSYLQLVALAENVRLEAGAVGGLLTLFRGDVRRCLLQLQLWASSGGGRAAHSDLQGFSLLPDLDWSGADSGDSRLLRCDVGCAASMLGLHPVTRRHLLNLLVRRRWSEEDMAELLPLLAESWRGGVPLLYSNLDLLLPPACAEGAHPGLPREQNPSDNDPHARQPGKSACSAAGGKSISNISRLSRRKYAPTTPGTTPPSRSTKKPPRTSPVRHKTGPNAAKAAVACLDPLRDFFDLMSFLDATMPPPAPLVSGPCTPAAFAWTGAEVKDGLLDEAGEEEEEEGGGGGRIQETTLMDIRAAVEGLGYRRCWRMSEPRHDGQEAGDAWSGRVEERLANRQSLSFSCQQLCTPSVAQRRYELSRTVLGRKPFGLLGNREAVSVDYMPLLRHICRSQRQRRQEGEPLRCPDYLRNIHLSFSKSTVQLLSEGFS